MQFWYKQGLVSLLVIMAIFFTNNGKTVDITVAGNALKTIATNVGPAATIAAGIMLDEGTFCLRKKIKKKKNVIAKHNLMTKENATPVFDAIVDGGLIAVGGHLTYESLAKLKKIFKDGDVEGLISVGVPVITTYGVSWLFHHQYVQDLIKKGVDCYNDPDFWSAPDKNDKGDIVNVVNNGKREKRKDKHFITAKRVTDYGILFTSSLLSYLILDYLNPYVTPNNGNQLKHKNDKLKLNSPVQNVLPLPAPSLPVKEDQKDQPFPPSLLNDVETPNGEHQKIIEAAMVFKAVNEQIEQNNQRLDALSDQAKNGNIDLPWADSVLRNKGEIQNLQAARDIINQDIINSDGKLKN